MPLAGHCQISLRNANMFIYGGFTLYEGRPEYNFNHTNLAWIWRGDDEKWESIPTKCPCQGSIMPAIMMEQCALRGQFEVVIVNQNFDKLTTCTSVLNISSFTWIKVSQANNLSMGGFILTGLNPMRTFYIGGLLDGLDVNNVPDQSYAATFHDAYSNYVFELINDDWIMMDMKLPYNISQMYSILINGNLNMTQCVKDKEIWPTQ